MVMKAKVTPTEEWQEAVKKHIDKLDDDDKREFAHKVIFDIALWTGCNVYEMVGMLDCIKYDLIVSANNIDDEEEDEDY